MSDITSIMDYCIGDVRLTIRLNRIFYFIENGRDICEKKEKEAH